MNKAERTEFCGRRANPDQLRMNTDVLYEDTFQISSYRQSARLKKHFNDCHPKSIRLLAYGRRSPMTGEIIRLECCFNAGGHLTTSIQAYRRFLERMNGVIPNDDPKGQLIRLPHERRKRPRKAPPKE